MIEQGDDVDFGESRQLAECLVHEHSAAVRRRADRVRGYEQHAELIGIGGDGIEAVAEVAAERAAEGFVIVYEGEAAGAPAGTERLGQTKKGLPQANEICAAGL